MKKIILTLVVLGVLGGGVYYLVRNRSSAATPEEGTPPQTLSTGATPVSSVSAAAVSVAIQNFSFNPKTLTVKKGTAVTWTNKDRASHTVTTLGNDGPRSGTLGAGDTYAYTFAVPGTFNYTCGFHPRMKGTVVVTE